MKILKITLVAITALTIFSSCKKTNSNSSAMEFQLQATNPSSTVLRTDGTGHIQWTSGFASANQIKFEAKNGSAEVELKANNSQRVDLFAPLANSLGNISVAPGNYTDVEFKIELSPSGNDAALELNGIYTNGSGISIPVIFHINSFFEIKAEQTNVTVADNNGISALTTLDLSVLSSGISQALFAGATISNGSIVITSSSNSNLYSIITANFSAHHEAEIHHH